MPPSCESENRTVQYLLHALPRKEEATALEHIEECPTCRTLWREGGSLRIELAAAVSRARRIERADWARLPPPCEETLGRLVATEEAGAAECEASGGEHAQACPLCATMALYTELRAEAKREPSGREGGPSRPCLSDRLTLTLLREPAEAGLDRLAVALAQPELQPAAAEVLATCRASRRWGAVAGEVRAFVARTVRGLRVRAREELDAQLGGIKQLGLLVAELLCQRRLQPVAVLAGGRARERVLEFVPPPFLGPSLSVGEVEDRSEFGPIRTRVIVLTRTDCSRWEWIFVVLRANGKSYVLGPDQALPGQSEVEVRIPAEIRDQPWRAEVYTTLRAPETLAHLSDREAGSEPALVTGTLVWGGSERGSVGA